MDKKGFTLMGMAVTVATIGILAVMARPAIETMYARGRQGEVKTNLHEIKVVQTTHVLNNGGVYGFDQFGYTGGGNYKCSASDMPGETFGWNPLGCNSLRYNYESRVQPAGSGKLAGYELVAHAPADQGEQYLYIGCNGAGSSIYGQASGDVWRLRMGGNPEVCRSIMDFCPDVSSKASKRCEGERFAGINSFVPTTSCNGGGGDGGGGGGGGSGSDEPTPPFMSVCKMAKASTFAGRYGNCRAGYRMLGVVGVAGARDIYLCVGYTPCNAVPTVPDSCVGACASINKIEGSKCRAYYNAGTNTCRVVGIQSVTGNTLHNRVLADAILNAISAGAY